MAKINCVIDTEAKTYDISVDGQKMDKVVCFEMYCDGDDYCGCCIRQSEKMENGISKVSYLYASEKQVEGAVASEKYPGFQSKADYGFGELIKAALK